MTRTYRISIALVALIIGVAIVVVLSIAGKKTKGPLENLFSYTGEKVNEMENNIIIAQREGKRSDKLQWFKPYITDSVLLKKPETLLLGAYDNNTKESFESIVTLEDSLKTTFPLIHIYIAWGSKTEEQFPALQVRGIMEMGSVPVITWEPWLTDFDGDKYPQLRKPEYRDKGGLVDVSKGLYDFYIKEWADAAAKIKGPIFLRIGHEMNDPYRYPWGPQNNSAKEFIAAWRHIHDVFIKEGATNVIWTWSPHPAYGFFKEFYPGANYVDYVGVGTLNYGTVASWSKWWSFKEIFGNYYNALAAFNKPIIITEFGCLNVGGSRSEWFADALDSLPEKYPAVRSIVFFHYNDDKTTTQQAINWYIKEDTATIHAIRKRIVGVKP
ncbi:MAG: hypothetical protein JWO06_1292 [Bacteroidota bacterium]|nr:hypothetical protein [Bacteroidota bacterium]